MKKLIWLSFALLFTACASAPVNSEWVDLDYLYDHFEDFKGREVDVFATMNDYATFYTEMGCIFPEDAGEDYRMPCNGGFGFVALYGEDPMKVIRVADHSCDVQEYILADGREFEFDCENDVQEQFGVKKLFKVKPMLVQGNEVLKLL